MVYFMLLMINELYVVVIFREFGILRNWNDMLFVDRNPWVVGIFRVINFNYIINEIFRRSLCVEEIRCVHVQDSTARSFSHRSLLSKRLNLWCRGTYMFCIICSLPTSPILFLEVILAKKYDMHEGYHWRLSNHVETKQKSSFSLRNNDPIGLKFCTEFYSDNLKK